MKLTAIILLAAGLLAAQNTPVFPGRAATNGDLFIATNNFATTLLTGITSATATSATVASATGLTIPAMVTIDTEIFAVCRIAGNTLTFGKSSCPNADGRGYDGSVAVNHVAGRPVEARVVAGLHNQPSAEVIALENATPVMVSDLGPYVTLAAANAAAVTAGRSLAISKSWTGLPTQTVSNPHFVKGGLLQPASGQVVTISGQYHCPEGQQCFDTSLGGAGSVIFTGGAALQTLDIRAMGAKCNGVFTGTIAGAPAPPFTGSNDTLAVQSAFSAFPVLSSFAQITSPPGATCLIDSVTWRAPVALTGQGTSFGKTGSSSQGMFYAGPANANGLTIRNVAFFGDPAIPSDCIHIENGAQTNSGMYNVAALYCQTGIYLKNANDYTLQDVYSQDNSVRNLDIELGTDINFAGTNVFQAFGVKPTDNVLISGAVDVYGGGIQCELVYNIPCMNFTNAVVNMKGITSYWAGTYTVPAGFTISQTGSGRVQLYGINTWVMSGTVTMPYLVADTELLASGTGTLNWVAAGNAGPTAGFNQLQSGDYTSGAANAQPSGPFGVVQSALNVLGVAMAPVSSPTGNTGAASLYAICGKGGDSTNAAGTGGTGGFCFAQGGPGGGSVTGGQGGNSAIQGGPGGTGSATGGRGGVAAVIGGGAGPGGNAPGGAGEIFGGAASGTGEPGRVYIQRDATGNVYKGNIYTNLGQGGGIFCPPGTAAVINVDQSGILFGTGCGARNGFSRATIPLPACTNAIDGEDFHVADGKPVGTGGTYKEGDGTVYRNVHCANGKGWQYF